MKKALPYIIALFLAAFGVLTLFLSSSVIFDLFGIRAKEGHYVLFVVWANFISSLFYLFAAYGFVKNKKWTVHLLGVSAIVLMLALIGLLIHINTGRLYEIKTIAALIFRTTITVAFALSAYFMIFKNKK